MKTEQARSLIIDHFEAAKASWQLMGTIPSIAYRYGHDPVSVPVLPLPLGQLPMAEMANVLRDWWAGPETGGVVLAVEEIAMEDEDQRSWRDGRGEGPVHLISVGYALRLDGAATLAGALSAEILRGPDGSASLGSACEISAQVLGMMLGLIQ